MAEDRANSNARVFPTLPGMYNEGVNVIPGGSKPPTKPTNSPLNRLTPEWVKFNSEVLSSMKNSVDGKTAPTRPAPNQGTKVVTPGVGTKTFGGSQPGAIPITGPTPPKNPGRVATFFKGVKGGGLGPMLGGGGPFNKID